MEITVYEDLPCSSLSLFEFVVIVLIITNYCIWFCEVENISFAYWFECLGNFSKVFRPKLTRICFYQKCNRRFFWSLPPSFKLCNVSRFITLYFKWVKNTCKMSIIVHFHYSNTMIKGQETLTCWPKNCNIFCEKQVSM